MINLRNGPMKLKDKAALIASGSREPGKWKDAPRLAVEVRSSNIRVNSVEPGYVATKLIGYRPSAGIRLTDVFVYLASGEASGMTGKMLGLGMEVSGEISAGTRF